MPPAMLLVSLVTCLILLLFLFTLVKVGRARAQFKIAPPQVDGPEEFQRIVRVQYNTLEQLVLFLPSMWLFAYFVHPLVAAILGILWLIARIYYAVSYYKDASKRLAGFVMGVLIALITLLGAMIGIIYNWLNLP